MKVAVIGGGASGAVATILLKRKGYDVLLIEKNEKIGKKLYITGKGRCNLTNDCSGEEFLLNVVSNPKFLMSSINSFDSQSTIEFFEGLNLKLKTERGNRVFPLSDKSSDVIKALTSEIVKLGVDIHFNETVKNISLTENGNFSILTDKNEYFTDKVVVATGGLSYPSTGSTGDGYTFAKRFGHTVTECFPSLCGINLKGDEFKDLQGITLKNVSLKAEQNGKAYYEEQGEMLFTHYGVSGPLVLTLSALTARRSHGDINIYIDFKPALSEKQLDARLLREFLENKTKDIKNVLFNLLPKAVVPLVLKRCNIPEFKKVSVISQKERESLINVLKGLKFEFNGLRGYNEAVITSGGVSVKEINPKTMESKLVKGLYFIGEVLDVDAFTGGFNLQIAFSTANSCASQI